MCLQRLQNGKCVVFVKEAAKLPGKDNNPTADRWRLASAILRFYIQFGKEKRKKIEPQTTATLAETFSELQNNYFTQTEIVLNFMRLVIIFIS